MFIYRLELVCGQDEPRLSPQAATDLIKSLLADIQNLEHVHIRDDGAQLQLGAFIAAPDGLAALPTVSEIRSALRDNAVHGWQLTSR